MSSSGKHIERLVRRAFVAMLRLMSRESTGIPDPGTLHPARILLLRHDRIGDAIISTPTIALLRERFPDARIDILLGAKNSVAAPLLESLDHVMILPTEPVEILRAIQSIRHNRYDVVVNLLAKDSASGALVTTLSGGRVRIGFEGALSGSYDIVVAKPETQLHIVRETSLLLGPFGIEPIGEKPAREVERLHVAISNEERAAADSIDMGLPEGDMRTIVAINISASGPEKYWGSDRYIALARALLDVGLHPVIAAAPRDSDESIAIGRAAGCTAIPITRSLAGFAAILDRADIIATPDTSIVHIAAALGKPTVMLAPDSAVGNIWSPWGVQSRIVAGNGSIDSVDVDTFARAIRELATATAPAYHTSSAS